jgi:serine/threonine-protein kinase
VQRFSLDNQAGHLQAVNLGDGRPLWERPLGSTLWGRPAASQSTVYVTSGREGLVALDAATGVPRWTHTDRLLSGSPTLAGDLVLVHAPLALLALDAATGKPRWSAPVAPSLAAQPPLVDGGVVFVSGLRGVHALELASGRELWARPGVSGKLAVDDEQLYVAGIGGLQALDRKSGQPRWRTRSAGGAEPVVKDGVLYSKESGLSSRLLASDSRTGARLLVVDLQENTWFPPLWQAGRVWLSNREELVSLSTVQRQRGSTRLGSKIHAPLAAGEAGMVVVATEDGTVQALR